MPVDATERIDVIRAARAEAGSLLLGLDFDGTLAPIVPRFQDAALLDVARDPLERLSARTDTHIAFVSGRSIRDLRERTGLGGVYHAGNHGLEIAGPGVEEVHDGAAAARPALDALVRDLQQDIGSIEGVIIEDKGLTLSVHFRLVHDAAVVARVRTAVHVSARAHDRIRLTDGKQVVEIRPDVDWHKGRAFEFLRTTLEERFGRGPALFIGDDRTDEDVFHVLGPTDWSIVVGDPPQHRSIAQACLRSPEHVAEFLRALV